MLPGFYNIFITDDGSHSIRIQNTKTTFHSSRGAIQESQHVFINAGLNYFADKNPDLKSISIFEIGFGTGLNALLAAKQAQLLKKNVVCYSIDLNALPAEIYTQLNYATVLNETELYKTIMQTGWNQLIFITPFFKLNKIAGDFKNYSFNKKFDIIFFDAFAPEEEPELWAEAIFNKIFAALNTGGILVTYCSKSVVRKMLEQAGFRVEKLNGPPGKREIIRAAKIE